jgi:hypothetical protein
MVVYQNELSLPIHAAIAASESSNEKKLFNRLNEIKDGSVLDVGFRYPTMFYALYHMFKFKKFEGVDKSTKKDCLNKFQKGDVKDEIINQKIKEANSFFDIYDALVAPEPNQLPKLGEEDFNNLFYKNLHFQTEIQDFLENHKNEKYDFINLSNVIHFLKNNTKAVISKCISMLTSSGILYIRVQTENVAENEKQLLFLKAFFNPTQEILVTEIENEIKCVELWYYK